jgi:hypothetical protein
VEESVGLAVRVWPALDARSRGGNSVAGERLRRRVRGDPVQNSANLRNAPAIFRE